MLAVLSDSVAVVEVELSALTIIGGIANESYLVAEFALSSSCVLSCFAKVYCAEESLVVAAGCLLFGIVSIHFLLRSVIPVGFISFLVECIHEFQKLEEVR